MKIRIADVISESVVDGTGLRYVIFTQGCPHHCEGCHNPQTWNPRGGKNAQVEDLIREFTSDPLINGITLSGGEPFSQAWECWHLARAAHIQGLSVWCYTGYKFEQLRDSGFYPVTKLLNEIDVLVDGRFEVKNKTYDLPWGGSRNQRLIYLERGVVKRIESEE